MADHTYFQHLGDNGLVAPLVVDRDDGVHLLASASEVVAWLAAGNTLLPAPARPRTAPGFALIKAAKGTKMSARDLAYIGGRPSVPETADSVARIATGDGTTPSAWFDAALGVSA